MLGLYASTGSSWALSAQAQVNVVDEHSSLIRLPVNPRNMGNSAVSVSLGEDGTPESFGVSKASPLAAMAEGVNAALAGFQAGTDSAVTTLGNLQKAQSAVSAIRSAPVQQRFMK